MNISMNKNKTFDTRGMIIGFAVAMILLQAAAMAAQLPVALGSDATFGVLAGSTVTSTGATTVNGDLGVSPGTALTGSPTVTGTIHLGDAVAAQAQADLTIAYNNAAGRNVAPITVSGNIGGQTLAPGLYKSTSSLAISSGDLTLDGGGDTNAVWIFQIASTLVTTSGRQVNLINGAKAGNVFWQVGSSATIGSSSVFVGTIMADQSITLVTSASLDGRALARIGAVTMDSNTITLPAPANTNVDTNVIVVVTNSITNVNCGVTSYDFNNDNVSDIAVFNPQAANWYILQSGSNILRQVQWGWNAAVPLIPVPADYDGDTVCDIAIYYPGDGIHGEWYILRSSDGQLDQRQFGWSAGYPIPGDYDGDGKADLAVYNHPSATWYIQQSSDDKVITQQWGWDSTIPVPGDYDGDGKTDIATFDPATGTWYILKSTDYTLWKVQWGYSTSPHLVPVPADYDGDCKTDIAVYDPTISEWFIRYSTDGSLHQEQWGFPGVTPVPADYDGDARADITVYNQASGDWYIHQSGDNTLRTQHWGWSAAQPVTLQSEINRRIPSF